MKEKIKERVLHEASRIVETKKTLRELSKEFGVSKSTIHKDMQQKLILLDKELYRQVQRVFEEHLMSRYYIGGESTKKKYKKII